MGIRLILLAIMILVFYYGYLFLLEQKNDNDVSDYIDSTSVQTKVKADKVEEIEMTEMERNEESKTSYQINYKAVLEIQKINLKRGVVDSTNKFKSINYAISVDTNSNYPDSMGNFILYAHSGSASYSYFKKLNNLEIDDIIYVYYKGIKYQYRINKKYDIPKNGKAKVISSNSNRYITLITCNPNKDGYQIILIGKLVDSISY